MKETNRIPYIDTAKGIDILAVIIFHIPVFLKQNGYEFEYIAEAKKMLDPWIVPWFMAVFFFVSGLCTKYDRGGVKFLKKIGRKYLEEGTLRDEWQKDFRKTRKFLIKYSNIKYEKAGLRDERNRAYTEYFGAGQGLMVEYDVNISRQHYLNGSIKIGNNVLLAKNVFIDYSGKVEIKDNVRLTNGVIIETHYHPFHSDWKEPRKNVCATELVIEEGAVVGSRAIIMPTCHYIGKNARVGAGAVVTHDVPDYSIVVGAPAKVVRTMEH